MHNLQSNSELAVMTCNNTSYSDSKINPTDLDIQIYDSDTNLTYNLANFDLDCYERDNSIFLSEIQVPNNKRSNICILNDKGEVIEPELEDSKEKSDCSEIMPNPIISQMQNFSLNASIEINENEMIKEQNKIINNKTKFKNVVNVYGLMLKFINKLKMKLKAKNPEKFDHISVKENNYDFLEEIQEIIIKRDQQCQYKEIFNYLNNPRQAENAPDIVNNLNIYLDEKGLLRVKGKKKDFSKEINKKFPLLLSKDSRLTKLLILDYHEKYLHSGCYVILSKMRKKFWIPHYFSVVRKSLKSCIKCNNSKN